MNNLDKVIKAVHIVAEEIKLVVKLVLDGYNLGDSQLYKDLNVSVEDIDLIKFSVNDYIEYIQGGRKAGSGKKGGFPDYPKLEIIAAWCASKGLPTDNETVLRISWGIYWHGIKNPIDPRPIFETLEGGWENGENSPLAQEIERHWDAWSEIVIDAITSNLDEFFNN